MEIKFEERNGWLIVSPDGSLNIHSAQEFKFMIKSNLSKSNQILLDFRKVVNIDSVGIGCLIFSQQLIREHEGALRISGLSKAVKIIFQVTRGYETFDIYEEAEVATGQKDLAA